MTNFTMNTTPRKSKRSRVAPIALIGAAAFALSACQKDEVETRLFANVAECKAAAEDTTSWMTAEECDKSFADAESEHARTAPRYDSQKLCEEQHGGACYTQKASGGSGSSIFLPLMAGYMMGNMLNGGSRAQPIYQTKDNKFSTASGSATFNSNRGATKTSTSAFNPAKSTRAAAPMTRTSVSKTGGFGSSRTSSFGSSSRSSFGG